MLSREHIQILVQSVGVVAALHFAKGYMTGEYRNLMAVGLVVVVLTVADRLVTDYEGADTKKDDTKHTEDHSGVRPVAVVHADPTTHTTPTHHDDTKKEECEKMLWLLPMDTKGGLHNILLVVALVVLCLLGYGMGHWFKSCPNPSEI